MTKVHLKNKYKAIVIGVSAGGMNALSRLLAGFEKGFPLPIIIAQHLHATDDGFLFQYFNDRCSLKVKEADEKEAIRPGHIYFAPPNYHLLIERDKTFSLSIDEKVRYSRPSIDVLFESASRVWLSGVIGIILTGANDDGARGIRCIKQNGGLTIAQDPATAEYPFMPRSAIDLGAVDEVLPLEAIAKRLTELVAHIPESNAASIKNRKEK